MATLSEQEIINRNNINSLHQALILERSRIDEFKAENDGLRKALVQIQQETNALRTQLATVMASSMGHSTSR